MIISICKGCHYSSGWSLGSVHTGVTFQEFKVKFSASCLTLPGKPNCDTDTNKLFGWSHGHHHSNSIRMGWRSAQGLIRLSGYIYQNGIMTTKGFVSVPVNTWITCGIEHVPELGIVRFYANGKTLEMPYTRKPSWGYLLKPYFGGDCPAPVNMTIEIV